MTESPLDNDTSIQGLFGVVQRTVIFGQLPALVVVHDDEGDWLIGDGVNNPNDDDASGIFHLAHVIRIDPSIASALSIPVGYAAYREDKSSPWRVSPWEYED